MTIFAAPGQDGSPVAYKSRYEHYIGGEWVPPVKGGYFENPSPVTGENFTEIAPAGSGRTVTTPIRPTRRSGATRTRASGGRITR